MLSSMDKLGLRLIAKRLGPEFADVNIVGTNEVPAVRDACLYGFALPAGGSPLDDRPLVALNRPAIAEDAAAGSEELCERIVLCHELAHVVTTAPVAWTDEQVAIVGDQMPAFRAHLLSKWDQTVEPAIDASDAHHGAAFVRAIMHCVYRMRYDASVNLPLGQIIGCVGDGWLSPEAAYWETLKGEACRRRRDLFADILASEPPPAFTKLWGDDVALYHSREQARCDYLKQREERLAKC